MGKLLFGSIIEEYSIKAKTDTNYVVCSVTNTNGFQKSSDTFDKKVFSEDLSAYKKVYRGSFAYNPSRINVGSIGCQNIDECVLVSPLYNIFEVNTDVTTPEFVSYFIRSNYVRNYIKENTQGTVRANFKMSEMSKLHFPNITLDEQKRIIEEFKILEKVIKENEHQLFLYDELVKSRFVEMFVDKYEKIQVSTKLRTTSGGTPKSDQSEYYANGTIPWLTSGEVNQGRIEKTEKFITEKGLTNSSAKWIPKKSIVIAMYGATAGKVGIIEMPTTTNQAVCAVLPHDEYNPEYLRFAFEYISEELAGKAVGGGQPNISQAIIKDSLIFNPPLEVQIKFSAFVQHVDKLKFIVEEQLKLMNELLNKKMDEYFN